MRFITLRRSKGKIWRRVGQRTRQKWRKVLILKRCLKDVNGRTIRRPEGKRCQDDYKKEFQEDLK